MKSDTDFNSKNFLRAQFRKMRGDFGYSEKKKKAEREITENFLSLEEYKNAGYVLLYAATEGEISADEIFKSALAAGKKVYFPKSFSGGIMEFYRVESLSELSLGKFGIREPSGIEKFENQPDALCVVPGFSFDKNGYRLGYGGGYYDRFLADFSGIKAGLCLSDFVSDKLPNDSFDISADIIVTEKGVMRIK